MWKWIQQWLLVPMKLTQIVCQIHNLFQEIEDLRQRLRVAVPTRRLAFVWGTCSRVENRSLNINYDPITGVSSTPKEYSQKVTSQIHCEPYWACENEEFSFYIDPYFPIADIKLKINEPFIITDICIGNCSQSVSLGGSREWLCSEMCMVGNRITIRAKWPTQKGE